MKRRLLISPRANQDIDEQFAYLAEENFATAVQFYDAAFQTFDDLLLRPFKCGRHPGKRGRPAQYGVRRLVAAFE